jgi:hypothetical protein
VPFETIGAAIAVLGALLTGASFYMVPFNLLGFIAVTGGVADFNKSTLEGAKASLELWSACGGLGVCLIVIGILAHVTIVARRTAI